MVRDVLSIDSSSQSVTMSISELFDATEQEEKSLERDLEIMLSMLDRTEEETSATVDRLSAEIDELLRDQRNTKVKFDVAFGELIREHTTWCGRLEECNSSLSDIRTSMLVVDAHHDDLDNRINRIETKLAHRD